MCVKETVISPQEVAIVAAGVTGTVLAGTATVIGIKAGAAGAQMAAANII